VPDLKRAEGQSLAHNAGWMLFGQVLSVVCQAASFMLLARLLGSMEYGIYAGAYAMVSLLSPYSPLGSHFTLLRHVSQDSEQFPVYWGNVLVTTFVCGGIFVVALSWIGPHAAHDFTALLVFCLAVSDCLCNQLIDASSRVFQAFENLRVTATFALLANFLRAVSAGIMLWKLKHGTALEWVIVTMTISIAAAASAVTIVIKQYGRPRFSFSLLRRRAGEGVVFALSSSTMAIYNNVDKAMLGHYGMNVANGIYSMAYRVIDIATMPIAAIHAAAFPRFFRKGADGVELTSKYGAKLLSRTLPLAIAMLVGMLVCGPLVPILAGKGFAQSVVALHWLCLIPVFRSFQLSGGDALTGAGFLRLRLGIQAVAALSNFAVNLYLIPHFGWIGAAWSSLATDGALAVSNWLFVFIVRRMRLRQPASPIFS